MLKSFVADQLNAQLRFTEELDEIYAHEIEGYQQSILDFGRTTYTLENESLPSVAWQFDRFFPAHYFKAFYSLLKMG